MKEYNQFWVDNVPYVDIPDQNIKKMSYYRTWENRFNTFDGNIPGNDYQFPVDLEGALGYNNQISLTVPMRLNDLMFWRDPVYSYSSWLSQGEESRLPERSTTTRGNTAANWNNTYEQGYPAAAAWQDYEMHGGPPALVQNLAHYSECDIEGTLAKFDTNHNNLIEYSAGTLPGNDADSVSFSYYGTRPQDMTDTALWVPGAQDAAQEYSLLGETSQAQHMTDLANAMSNSIMTNLWANGPVGSTGTTTGGTGTRATGKFGNGLLLNGSGQYVTLPSGFATALHGLSDFTIDVWVNPAADTQWSRVFDIGTGTTAYMFLTVNAGSGPRFSITTSGSGGEQQLNSSTQLPLNTWTNARDHAAAGLDRHDVHQRQPGRHQHYDGGTAPGEPARRRSPGTGLFGVRRPVPQRHDRRPQRLQQRISAAQIRNAGTSLR